MNIVSLNLQILSNTMVYVEPYGYSFQVKTGDKMTLRFVNYDTQRVEFSISPDELTICCYEPVILVNDKIEFDMSLP
jgi:hypothetical protein